jgi:hypothetical protein
MLTLTRLLTRLAAVCGPKLRLHLYSTEVHILTLTRLAGVCRPRLRLHLCASRAGWTQVCDVSYGGRGVRRKTPGTPHFTCLHGTKVQILTLRVPHDSLLRSLSTGLRTSMSCTTPRRASRRNGWLMLVFRWEVRCRPPGGILLSNI